MFAPFFFILAAQASAAAKDATARAAIIAGLSRRPVPAFRFRYPAGRSAFAWPKRTIMAAIFIRPPISALSFSVTVGSVRFLQIFKNDAV
ncbi:hypothetical protein ACV229_04730 [Burkholderia sp. MR1-5-21]